MSVILDVLVSVLQKSSPSSKLVAYCFIDEEMKDLCELPGCGRGTRSP